MDEDDKSIEQPIDEIETPEESAGEETEELTNQEDTVEAEETVEEDVSQEAQPEEATQEHGTNEAPEQPSRRENLRIQRLVSRQRSEAQQPQQAQTRPTQPTGIDYASQLQAEPETVRALEQDRQAYGQAMYEQALQQAGRQTDTAASAQMFHTRLEIDAPKVSNKFPMLDTDSDQFHPAIADTVNEMYLSTAGFNASSGSVQNPDLRYADYVEGVFELADEIATGKVESSRKNIVSQAAKTGLRPDGSKSKGMNLDQAPTDMSDEELEAFISRAMK